MRALIAIAFAGMLGVAVTGCGDDAPVTDHHDAAPADAGPDQGALERPPVLPRPPSQGLPAELFPPR